jgi:anti-sigma B factor antagonist
MFMAMKTENKNGAIVCYMEGEIDINTAPDMKKNFEKILAKKVPKMVINFSKVTYVDSSGLATLVEILKLMRTYDGKLRLSNLSPKIKSLFEITKLEKLFEIMADETQALADFV